MTRKSGRQSALDPEILDCLMDVMDPEIGLSIVDLGLVYQANRTPEAVQVALTLTTRACPLGEMIVEEARERLTRRFQDASQVDVGLVWDPLWKPDFITARGQELLGRTSKTTP